MNREVVALPKCLDEVTCITAVLLSMANFILMKNRTSFALNNDVDVAFSMLLFQLW